MKRKNTSVSISWDETKALLGQKIQYDWLNKLSSIDTSLQSEKEELRKDAARKKSLLQEQLRQERSAFAQESASLSQLTEQIHELTAEVADLQQSLSELRDTETEIRSNIRLYKKEQSQQRSEFDALEVERMQQIPKLKNQISLYAKTTGIRWDFHRDHVLAGEVAIPSLGVVTRFSIDPREYNDFQIANYLWSAMDGDVDPAIKDA